MRGPSTVRATGLARLLLYSGLLGMSGLVWSLEDYHDRGRGTRGSYNGPVERPTLPTPGSRNTVHQQPLAGAGQADGGGEIQQHAALESRQQPQQPALRADAQAGELGGLLGRPVTGANGEALGTVRAVVRSKQQQTLQAVVVTTSLAGLGEKVVAVPLERLQSVQEAEQQQGGAALTSGLSQEELRQMAVYQPDDYEMIEPPESRSAG